MNNICIFLLGSATTLIVEPIIKLAFYSRDPLFLKGEKKLGREAFLRFMIALMLLGLAGMVKT